MQDARLRHIMSSPVISIDVEAPVSEMLRLFAMHPVHHIPVLADGELCGMLSTADLLKLEHFLPRGSADRAAELAILDRRLRIELVMRRPVLCAAPEETIADAAARMASRGVHALPVLGGEGALLGIVTTTDIIQALLHGVARSADRAPSEAGELHALRERNRHLELLRQDVSRYLRGGQDEGLHSHLLRDIERLERERPLPDRV